MIKIFTDSGADLEPNELEILDIKCVPLSVTFDNITYKENINLTKKGFYKLLKLKKEKPTTSQPSPEDFFKLLENNGDEYIGIFLSSKISGTYQNAKYCFTNFNCYPIDSESASAGMRILIEESIKLKNQGLSAKEIVMKIEELKKRIVVIACVDSPEYLLKGGRIKASMMSTIKPIVAIEQGKITLIHKCIGTQRGINYIANKVVKNHPDFSYPFHIMYADNHSMGVKLKEKLLSDKLPINNHSLVNVGAVIGSHTGPNAFGVAYVKR